MSMRKSIIMAVICGMIFGVNTIPVTAAEIQSNEVAVNMESEVMPRLTCIAKANGSLSISKTGNATVSVIVRGVQGNVTRTVITAYLQRYQNGQWVTVKTFSKDSNSYTTTMSENYQVSKGYTYRVSASVRAYTSSSSEGRTVVSSEVTY